MTNLFGVQAGSSTEMLIIGLFCGVIICVTAILLALVRKKAATKTTTQQYGEGNEKDKIKGKKDHPEKHRKIKAPKPDKKEKALGIEPSRQTPIELKGNPGNIALPKVQPAAGTASLQGANKDAKLQINDNMPKSGGGSENSVEGQQFLSPLPKITSNTTGAPVPFPVPKPPVTTPSIQAAPEIAQEEKEEEKEESTVNDAFSIFTDTIMEETETSKFAKTLNNVDIVDLHQEVQDLAIQLKHWR